MERPGMAKRATRSGITARARNRTGGGPVTENGKNKPVLAVETNGKGQILSHIHKKWLMETFEERVRQSCVVTLHNQADFDLDQMDDELHIADGRTTRNDVVILRSAQDIADSNLRENGE